MFRRSVALIQRVIGRGFLRHPRPMTRWGSLSLVRWGRSLRSRPHRASSPAARKLGWSLRSLQARKAPYPMRLIMPSRLAPISRALPRPPFRGLPRPRTPAAPYGPAVLGWGVSGTSPRLRVRWLPLSAPPPLVIITPYAPLLCALRAHGGTGPPLAGPPPPARFRGARLRVARFPPPRPYRGRAVSRHKGGAFLIG